MLSQDRLEYPAMGREAQVKKLVNDNVILKTIIMINQIKRQSNGPR